jgi:HD superfamily phosphodiesterase
LVGSGPTSAVAAIALAVAAQNEGRKYDDPELLALGQNLEERARRALEEGRSALDENDPLLRRPSLHPNDPPLSRAAPQEPVAEGSSTPGANPLPPEEPSREPPAA